MGSGLVLILIECVRIAQLADRAGCQVGQQEVVSAVHAALPRHARHDMITERHSLWPLPSFKQPLRRLNSGLVRGRPGGSSVDERLGALGHRLGYERGRPGDPDAVDQIIGPDIPAGRALGAHCHRTRGQDPGQQVGQRRGMREREVPGPPREAEPGGLAGEPQRDGNAAGGRGRGDREGLVAALRVVLACRDLDDKRALGHAETLAPARGAGACRLRRGAGPHGCPARTIAGYAWHAERRDPYRRARRDGRGVPVRGRAGVRGRRTPWRSILTSSR